MGTVHLKERLASPPVAPSQVRKIREATVYDDPPPAALITPHAANPDALRSMSRIIAMSCAGFNLRRAARAVTQHFDHALAPCGLRTTQFTLLAAMALAGPVTTNELARALVMDRTTLTRNVRLLREAGWVAAGPGSGGRELRFELSAGGRDLLAAAIPIWQDAQSGIEEAYGTAAWPDMVAELGRLVVGTLLLTPGEQPPAGLLAAMQARAATGAGAAGTEASDGTTVTSPTVSAGATASTNGHGTAADIAAPTVDGAVHTTPQNM